MIDPVPPPVAPERRVTVTLRLTVEESRALDRMVMAARQADGGPHNRASFCRDLLLARLHMDMSKPPTTSKPSSKKKS